MNATAPSKFASLPVPSVLVALVALGALAVVGFLAAPVVGPGLAAALAHPLVGVVGLWTALVGFVVAIPFAVRAGFVAVDSLLG